MPIIALRLRHLSSSTFHGTEFDLKKHTRVTAQQLSDSDNSESGYKRRYKGEGGIMQLQSERSGFSTRCESKRNQDDERTSGHGDDIIGLLPTNPSIHVRQTTTMSDFQ